MRGLYALKPWYARRLELGVRLAVRHDVSPDTFTAVGVACAAGAAAAVAVGWWGLAAVLMAGRLAGANLDGAVARARGVSRPWGFVLNEVGDRLSDLLAFAGLYLLAVQTGAPGELVLLAALASHLPTFASLAAAGAGAERTNGGPLGKTERCLLVVLAAALPGWIPVICGGLVLGGIATAILRLGRSYNHLTVRDVATGNSLTGREVRS